jgi:hypothetical protein
VAQIDMFPLGIVKVRISGRLLIAFGKLPAEAIDCRCGNMERGGNKNTQTQDP